jgi:hypothetical protein
MSKENARYEFDGFTFGDEGDFNLILKAIPESGIGYSAKFEIELTPEERQELITVLITLGLKKEDR